MSAVHNDIMSSLNELLDAAQGKETEIVVHLRTVKDVEVFSPQQIKAVEWMQMSTAEQMRKH